MTIINGGLGGKGRHLTNMVKHLTRLDENDRVDILEIDQSLPSSTIEAALTEWQTLATSLTRSKKGFYEANINIRDDESLTDEQWLKAADILEEELGFQGQPRLIVQHEKKGRTHIHVLWQSTIVEEGRIACDSHNYRKHEEAAKEIERVFELEPSPRKYTRNKDEEILHAEFDRGDEEKAKRSGLSVEDRKALITELYEQSNSGAGFSKALEQEGFYLARGDQKNIFFVVDPACEAHRLSNCINGVKASQINKALFPIKAQNLMTVDEVKLALKEAEHSPEQASEIRKSYKNQRVELRAQQRLEKERLEATHAMANLQVDRERESKKPGKFIQFFQDITGISSRKLAFQEREDRERLAQQRIEAAQQEQIHRKEIKDLAIAEKQEIAKLDQIFQYNPGQQPRFQVEPDERKIQAVKMLVHELDQYDRNDQQLCGYNERIGRLSWAIKKHDIKKDELDVLKLDTAEQFNQFFKDGDQVLAAVNEAIEEKGIRKALQDLQERPQLYGDLEQSGQTKKAYENQQRVLSAVLVTGVRKAHYIEKRLETAEPAYEQNQRSLAFFQKKKLEYVTNPPKERLGLMLNLQKAAKGLSEKEWGKLEGKEKFEITKARNILKESDNMDQAKAYNREQDALKKNRERER